MFKIWERYDLKKYRITLIIIIVCLASVGMYVLGKVQADGTNLVPKQIKGLVLGLFGAVFISLIDYHFVCWFTPLMYLVNLGLLLVVKYVDRFNLSRGGVNRWIGIPNDGPNRWFEFQPAELSKVILVLCLATFLYKTMGKLRQGVVFILALVLIAGGVGLIFLQPDLSTTIVICASLAVVLFISGITYKILIPVVLIAIPLTMGLFWYVQQDFQKLLTDKQQIRVLSLLHPDTYTDDIYQQENSVLTIASGGLTGKAFKSDKPLTAKNIPVVESDFIFSGIAEAFGFLGSCVFIGLILLLSLECFRIGAHAPDSLGSMIAVGIGTTYLFQAFINIGVVTMLIPNTGIPLPFVSGGLSSLFCNMIGIGIVLNIGISKTKKSNRIDLDFFE